LVESAHLVSVDAHAYARHAIDAALASPGAITLPDVLAPPDFGRL
jgi:hypothetical protein